MKVLPHPYICVNHCPLSDAILNKSPYKPKSIKCKTIISIRVILIYEGDPTLDNLPLSRKYNCNACDHIILFGDLSVDETASTKCSSHSERITDLQCD